MSLIKDQFNKGKGEGIENGKIIGAVEIKEKINDSRINNAKINDSRINDSRITDSRITDSRSNTTALRAVLIRAEGCCTLPYVSVLTCICPDILTG